MGECGGYNLGSKSHLQGKLICQCQVQITYNIRVSQTLINSNGAWTWFVVKILIYFPLSSKFKDKIHMVRIFPFYKVQPVHKIFIPIITETILEKL